MSGAGSYPGTGHLGALPCRFGLAQEQQEPAAQPLPEKWVCLTFDDGPSKTTPDVLSALNAAGVHATFLWWLPVTTRSICPCSPKRSAPGTRSRCTLLPTSTAISTAAATLIGRTLPFLKERIAPYVDAESIRYLRFPGGSTNTVSRRYGGKGLMKQLKAEVEQKGWHWVDWNVAPRMPWAGTQARAPSTAMWCGDRAADELHRTDARFLHYTAPRQRPCRTLSGGMQTTATPF